MRDRYLAFVARYEAAWELTFAGLAVAFVIVGFAEESSATIAIELALTAIFATEFVTRLAASYDRAAYLRGHWIDLLALVPTVRSVRLSPLATSAASRARLCGRRSRAHQRRAARSSSGPRLAARRLVGRVILCSLALYAAENGVNEAVDSPLDALWWGISTMTTVGYGDVTPMTPEGRLAATVLMVLGIGLFLAVTATVTSFLMAADRNPLDDLAKLGDLRDRGLLTADEFDRQREAIARSLAG